MNQPPLTPAVRRGLAAFRRGLAALDDADHGSAEAIERAIARFQACLEWVTLETCPLVWAEAQIALADAYAQRTLGDPLENARTAITHYRAGIAAYLDSMGSLCQDEHTSPS